MATTAMPRSRGRTRRPATDTALSAVETTSNRRTAALVAGAIPLPIFMCKISEILDVIGVSCPRATCSTFNVSMVGCGTRAERLCPILCAALVAIVALFAVRVAATERGRPKKIQ